MTSRAFSCIGDFRPKSVGISSSVLAASTKFITACWYPAIVLTTDRMLNKALHRNSRLPFSLLMDFCILFPFWFAHRSPHSARLRVSLVR